MRASLLLGLSLCVASVCVPAVAQNASSTGEVHTRIQGIEIPAIPNAPFSARIVVTQDQPQAGGGVLSRKYYTMVARDSKGRVHRETRGFVAADSSAEPPLERTTILDPVAGRRTVCAQSTMVCTRSAFHPRPILGNDMAAGGDAQTANLGTRTMQGLSVQGTRKTMPASDGSSSIETETWFSPDLGIDLFVVRKSPQSGTVTLNVKDLQRGEPDASWFSAPSGFQMVKTRTR
ncbi:MAG TPA: hypothetical protein VMD29_02260 [Terracidiphilus sp.]|jgi:hypothetical protein|nr:hypothetical protein [Terracidiphilus sp.]